MYRHINAYIIYIYIYIHIYTCTYKYIPIYPHLHIYTHVNMSMYIYIPYVHRHRHIHLYTLSLLNIPQTQNVLQLCGQHLPSCIIMNWHSAALVKCNIFGPVWSIWHMVLLVARNFRLPMHCPVLAYVLIYGFIRVHMCIYNDIPIIYTNNIYNYPY